MPSIAVDLSFQHFEQELASLPGTYSPRRGALILARADGFAVGCIGLRPFSDLVGEIKRLYVVPAFRRHGLARSLVSSAIAAARSIGYSALVLDTLSSMRSAIALYESFGFQRTGACYPNHFPTRSASACRSNRTAAPEALTWSRIRELDYYATNHTGARGLRRTVSGQVLIDTHARRGVRW